jgi:small-conductance mechanosensitive channel
MSGDIYLQLHDRLTRGEILSEEEHSLLNTWYAEQDSEENAQINQALQPEDATTQLQEQIKQTAAQLQQVTQSIAATISANEVLRSEIMLLQARLAQQVSGRAA